MKKKLSVLCVLSVLLSFSAAQAESYKMAVGPAPGFLQKDGMGPGDILFTTVIKRLSQKGFSVTPERMPWKRADKMFNENKTDIEFPALLGDRALKNAIFSAPISQVGMVIFTRKDQPRLNSISELRGTVGIVRGFTYPKELDQQKNISLQISNDIASLLPVLSKGRMDAVLHWGASAYTARKQLGLEDAVHGGKEFTLSFGCFAAHMTPEGARVISEINQILGEMFVSGDYQRIMEGSYRSLLKNHSDK